MSNEKQKEILTPTDIAERYEIPKQTVAVWRSKGLGPRYFKAGRHVRYRLADVLAWEESSLSGGGDQ